MKEFLSVLIVLLSVICVLCANINTDIESEKEYYGKNARTLLTILSGPILNDYANRMWWGLVLDYYVKRWEIFFNIIRKSAYNNNDFDIESFNKELTLFENSWIDDITSFLSNPQGGTYEIAKRIYDRWGK